MFKLFKQVTREENGKVMLVHRGLAHMRIRMSLILGLGVIRLGVKYTQVYLNTNTNTSQWYELKYKYKYLLLSCI